MRCCGAAPHAQAKACGYGEKDVEHRVKRLRTALSKSLCPSQHRLKTCATIKGVEVGIWVRWKGLVAQAFQPVKISLFPPPKQSTWMVIGL